MPRIQGKHPTHELHLKPFIAQWKKLRFPWGNLDLVFMDWRLLPMDWESGSSQAQVPDHKVITLVLRS